jgi:hypothetical protein
MTLRRPNVGIAELAEDNLFYLGKDGPHQLAASGRDKPTFL